MAMGLTRTVGSQGIPVWQGSNKDIQLAQGGYSLGSTGLAADTIIPAGTPLIINESTRVATILGTAVLYETAGGSATAYKVKKGHTLKVGDYFATGAAGGAAYAITSINTSNADYDTVNVGTTIGAATVGDLMYASTATGGSSSAYPAANALLYDDTLANTGESVSAVIRGTVYARRVPYNTSIAALTGLKFIIYSQSK